MLLADVCFFLWIKSLVRRNTLLLFLAAVIATYGFTALGIALVCKAGYGLRHFATFRFLGMAAFWHAPALLSAMALAFGKRRLLLPALTLLILYFYAYHIEPYRLEITEHPFTHPLLRGLARPVTIAQVSDLQGEFVGAYEKHVLELLSDSRPDLIVYTGDQLHCWRAAYQEQALALSKLLHDARIRPPLGSYAVEGDSDERTLWKSVFEGEPVTILEDETVALQLPGVRANLTGLKAHTSRTFALVQAAGPTEFPDSTILHIYVGHSPDFVQSLAERGTPFLALAGHAHGGQVQLPFLGALITLTQLPRKYADWYGPYGPGVLSVSRGIGMERYDAPRLRFLCRPEIRLIRLEPY